MKDDLSIAMGKRMRELRTTHHLTQENISSILNISQKHVSYVEVGRSTLSLENLCAFCKYFNCSLDYLVLGITQDPALAELPKEIYQILSSGTKQEKEYLNRYLQMYIDLNMGKKKD